MTEHELLDIAIRTLALSPDVRRVALQMIGAGYDPEQVVDVLEVFDGLPRTGSSAGAGYDSGAGFESTT